MSDNPSDTTDFSDLPDLLSLSQEERIELALEAVYEAGTKPNGTLNLSLRRAAVIYRLPRSTLTNRYNGGQTRVDAHVQEMKLSPAQETVLVDWIKAVAQRGIPLNPQAVRDYAAVISGQPIGETWIRRFMARHPDLTVRWTTSLEQCRAKALNRPLVNEYFDLLEQIIRDYNIQPDAIYNMDEKGIQLGVGKRTGVLVDRDQKKVYQVESGNRELVTIIETVCADGTALRPSVIYQGMRRNFEWGRNNPCDASISHSPKGWTDQELGSLWLERDFEPQTLSRLRTVGAFRLLILDGHNSHCTYRFCKFAADNKIIVLCLPSHTTHALQPCDVGVFGPLSSAWKSEVVKASGDYLPITKLNLLKHYHNARTRAFKKETILSSFEKTGIHPFDRNVIDDSAFTPAMNTTTRSAQPLPAARPPLLVPVFHPVITETDDPSLSSETPSTTPSAATSLTMITTAPTIQSTSASTIDETPTVHYEIAGLPPALPRSATRDDLRNENRALRKLLLSAKAQIESDFAKMKLMDQENQRLRQLAFAKKAGKTKSRLSSSHPRHMTADESLQALARADFEAKMKLVLQEATVIFKKQREVIQLAEKEAIAAERVQERQQKAVEREMAAAAVRAQKELEKAAKQAERERKAAEKAAEKAAKQEERERKAAERVAERERKAAEKIAERERKAAEKAGRQAVVGEGRPKRVTRSTKQPS